MKKLLFIALLIPAFCFSQKVYHLSGLSINSPDMNLETGRIIKTNGTITIGDSLFTISSEGQIQTSKIVKKVDDNYFEITDGLKESTVKVINQKNGRYSGSIILDSEKATVVYLLKD